MPRLIIGFCNTHGKIRLVKKESEYPFIIGEPRFTCLKCIKNSVKVKI